MAIKYIVKLGWGNEYEFDDGSPARAFAEIALTHRVRDEDEERPREINIKIVEDE